MRGTTTVSSMAVETSDGEMVRAVLRSLAGFLRGEGPGAWSQACEAELAGPALPFFPHVDCHRNQAVLVWGTSRAPLTNM